MPDTSVLVLGCGVGGIVAARELRRLLPGSFRIVVIDRDADAAWPGSFLRLVTGERKPGSLLRHRARLARRGIEFVQGEVNQIDSDSRSVRAGSRQFHFDYLVIALGAEASLQWAPGLADACYSFYGLEPAERLAAHLRYFPGGRVALLVPPGAVIDPTLPYEAAMLLEHFFHTRGMRQKVEIDLYTAETAPLPVAGRDCSEALMGLLAHKGIELHTCAQAASVDPHRRELTFRDGATAGYDLLVAAPSQRPSPVLEETRLTDDGGWAAVKPATLETSCPNVFALGDAVYLRLSDREPLPRLASLAEQQARHVARQIAYRASEGPYPDHLEGSARQYLEVGGGAAAVLEGDFLAPQRRIVFKQPSLIWHWANLVQERYWPWRWY